VMPVEDFCWTWWGWQNSAECMTHITMEHILLFITQVVITILLLSIKRDLERVKRGLEGGDGR